MIIHGIPIRKNCYLPTQSSPRLNTDAWDSGGCKLLYFATSNLLCYSDNLLHCKSVSGESQGSYWSIGIVLSPHSQARQGRAPPPIRKLIVRRSDPCLVCRDRSKRYQLSWVYLPLALPPGASHGLVGNSHFIFRYDTTTRTFVGFFCDRSDHPLPRFFTPFRMWLICMIICRCEGTTGFVDRGVERRLSFALLELVMSQNQPANRISRLVIMV